MGREAWQSRLSDSVVLKWCSDYVILDVFRLEWVSRSPSCSKHWWESGFQKLSGTATSPYEMQKKASGRRLISHYYCLLQKTRQDYSGWDVKEVRLDFHTLLYLHGERTHNCYLCTNPVGAGPSLVGSDSISIGNSIGNNPICRVKQWSDAASIGRSKVV